MIYLAAVTTGVAGAALRQLWWSWRDLRVLRFELRRVKAELAQAEFDRDAAYDSLGVTHRALKAAERRADQQDAAYSAALGAMPDADEIEQADIDNVIAGFRALLDHPAGGES